LVVLPTLTIADLRRWAARTLRSRRSKWRL
jgi:hypothetical protein